MNTITTHQELPPAIREAAPDTSIAVRTDTLKELGERAAVRMGREDLRFYVEGEEAKA